MRVHEDHVAVAVPATTANLGPGFDSMGMALDLWDEVEVHATTRATSVVVEGEGADDVEKGDDNLIVRALRLALDRVGAPQVGIRMHCTNRIPHSRGLGSSASAIVAGVVAARALIGDPTVLTPDEVLDIGTEMEGHPDNVAPAVLGGATVAWMGLEGTVKRARAVRLDPPDIIRPVAFIPDFELKTSAARAALPSSVPHADACFNVSRAALLTALLSGASADAGEGPLHGLLMDATEDRLHQEYRRGVLPASMAVMDSLREQGYPAVISGAGPTVLVLSTLADQTRFALENHGWSVLSPGIDTRGAVLTS